MESAISGERRKSRGSGLTDLYPQQKETPMDQQMEQFLEEMIAVSPPQKLQTGSTTSFGPELSPVSGGDLKGARDSAGLGTPFTDIEMGNLGEWLIESPLEMRKSADEYPESLVTILECEGPMRPSSTRMKEFQKAKLEAFKEELPAHYDLPRSEAARRLGVCETMLKRRCRQLGIRKWPYRKMKSLQLRITSVKDQLSRAFSGQSATSLQSLEERLNYLHSRVEDVRRNPNLSFSSLLRH